MEGAEGDGPISATELIPVLSCSSVVLPTQLDPAPVARTSNSTTANAVPLLGSAGCLSPRAPAPSAREDFHHSSCAWNQRLLLFPPDVLPGSLIITVSFPVSLSLFLCFSAYFSLLLSYLWLCFCKDSWLRCHHRPCSHFCQSLREMGRHVEEFPDVTCCRAVC